MSKIKSRAALKKIVSQLKRKGKRIVFTNGCFDILHPGHIKIFTEAKKKGDILIVGVNSDLSVKLIKGSKRPILDQKSRSQLVAAFELVDYVTLFNELTPYELIKTIRPQVLVKGGDWSHREIVGRDLVEKVCRVKLKGGFSTTSIIKKIKRLK